MPNISRSKGNQTMKFDHLREQFFSKNNSQNVVEKLLPDPFLNNQNWTYLWINNLKFHTVCFCFMQSGRLSNYIKTRYLIKTKLQTSCFYHEKGTKKTKKRSGTILPVSFSVWFLIKNISLVIFYLLTKFYCLVVFTSWDIGQYVHCNCFLTRLWRHKIWN